MLIDMYCLVISDYAVLGGKRAQEYGKMEPQLVGAGEDTLLGRLPQLG